MMISDLPRSRLNQGNALFAEFAVGRIPVARFHPAGGVKRPGRLHPLGPAVHYAGQGGYPGPPFFQDPCALPGGFGGGNHIFGYKENSKIIEKSIAFAL